MEEDDCDSTFLKEVEVSLTMERTFMLVSVQMELNL